MPPRSSASPASSPTSLGSFAPTSAGAVSEAGILYVWGADDGIYRYDGATGALARVSGMASLMHETAYGPYVLGRHGGIALLRWDGSTSQICNGGLWADVSTRGNCANLGSPTDNAVYTDSPEGGAGGPTPRVLLPADWGATTFWWDVSGLQLALVRHETRPEPARGHDSLWVMDIRHGTLKKVFDSTSETSFISGVRWSCGSSKIAFLEQTSTSESMAADGANLRLWVVDATSGKQTDLGTVLRRSAWFQWTCDDRLAFVRGGGRETWTNKEIAVLEVDGTQRVVAGSLGAHPAVSDLVGLAPAWQPVGRAAKLAWIESPAIGSEASPDYFRGIGPAAQRVAVLDGTTRVACPDRVTEGVRWSADGRAVLLLCRVPGVDERALEVWYARVGDAPRPLVRNLGDLGFGYYGAQPSLFDLVAWSEADR